MIVIVNLTVITLIWHDSHLHKPMYFFLANLAFIEILYTTAITPNSLKSFLQEDRTISFIGCFTQIYFFVALAGSECILLSVMAYDRYIAICHPLLYSLKMNSSFCIHLVMLSWVIGFLNSLLQTMFLASLPYCNDHKVSSFFCDIPPLLKLSCEHNKYLEIFVNLIGECILVGDLVLTIISYIAVIKTVIRTPRKNRSYKTFSTCGSHLTVVTLFFGTILIPFLHPSSPSSGQDKVLAVIYGVITPLINPFIYTIRNADFQKAIEKWIINRNQFH
ncbi:olfactory receptor 6B2-like [Phyllobates terribilis]|uniref:olfactory receptor 6B2-like n=1 Tax=Phyllobates terribilis TaxID=111132 RepID=UPI003CCB1A95